MPTEPCGNDHANRPHRDKVFSPGAFFHGAWTRTERTKREKHFRSLQRQTSESAAVGHLDVPPSVPPSRRTGLLKRRLFPEHAAEAIDLVIDATSSSSSDVDNSADAREHPSSGRDVAAASDSSLDFSNREVSTLILPKAALATPKSPNKLPQTPAPQSTPPMAAEAENLALDDSAADVEEAELEGDKRISAMVDHFRRIPMLIPDLEFFFRLGTASMLDTLIGSLITPLKMVFLPHQVDRRDILTVFFTCVGLMTFYLCSWSESGMLYSSLYHTVRTAAIIKLYLLFNILEVSDKLLTSLLSDSLEVLYAVTTTRKPSASKVEKYGWGVVIGAFATSSVCVAIHSFVLLLHVVTLNVAINSEGNSLITLLISNNFVEVKSIVFKKYLPETLLQVCCADAVERVQLGIFVLCLVAQHLQAESFGTIQLFDIGVVIACELVIDFVKHYFVATFNSISLSLYRQFSHVLLFDVAREHILWRLRATLPITSEDPNADSSLLVRLVAQRETFVSNPSRRCGFVSMPYLAVLLWCSWPLLMGFVKDGAYLKLTLLLMIVAAVKFWTHTYLVGAAERFVVRSLLSPISRNDEPTPDVSTSLHCPVLHSNSAPLTIRRHSLAPQSIGTTSSHNLVGVSPQLTPMKCGQALPSLSLFRRKSAPLLRVANPPKSTEICLTAGTLRAPLHSESDAEELYSIHVSKIMSSLLRVERFDLNAGKWK